MKFFIQKDLIFYFVAGLNPEFDHEKPKEKKAEGKKDTVSRRDNFIDDDSRR